MVEIVLEGPAKNALGSDLLREVKEQLAEAGDRPVLLTGAGDTFSAGLNLKELLTFMPDRMGPFLDLLQDVVASVFHHPAPTVAAVNGHAIAGGAVLARACDHAVATSRGSARIGLNEVAMGLRFPPRLLDMMKAKLPRGHWSEVVLSAQLFEPDAALRLGLVDALADDPMAAARAEIERRAKLPVGAYAATKDALQGRVGRPDPLQDAAFVEQHLSAWTSDELETRIEAFLGKR